jgi:hypothetical protein
MHAVISQKLGEDLKQYHTEHNTKPIPIPNNWKKCIDLCDVPSPEDPLRTRKFVLQIITVPVVSDPLSTAGKGETDHDLETLAGYYFLDNIAMKGKIDATIVIASNEATNLKDIIIKNVVPKLLLLRFHSMMNSTVSDDEVQQLYELIGSVSGKRGFEMTRTGGSSGQTSDQTDVEFLHALHEVHTSLPRRLGACKITRDKLLYNVTYRKVTPKPGKNPVTTVKYCPVKRGGSFNMEPGMLKRYPWLGEFSYLKMTAVMILQALNDRRSMEGKNPVAVGPIKQEMENIIYARHVYRSTGSYFYFITNYNLRNRYSLVCHAVGCGGTA